MLLTLLTMLSWSEQEVETKKDTKTTHHVKRHKKDEHKTHHMNNARSEQDIDGKNLSKYTDKGLVALINLFKTCIARNDVRDPEDLDRRLAYQKKRGGKTACGRSYAALTMSEFLNVLEDETAEMERDIKDAEAELAKRGHKCGCKVRS
jgi:hypothetical protein